MKSLGGLLRSVGRAIDDIGVGMQGKFGYVEQLTPSLAAVGMKDAKPTLGKEVFIAPNATVVGDVKIGQKSSIWYGAVLRGDVNNITIGEQTNIQDNAVVHVAKNVIPPGSPHPTTIGSRVTIGHGAIVHACSVGDDCLVGMGAKLLDGVKMEQGSIVAGGAMVLPGVTIPTGQIWAGTPARFLRALTADEAMFISSSASRYADLADVHREETSKTFDEIEWDKIVRADRLERDPDYDSHMGVERDPKTREIKYMASL